MLKPYLERDINLSWLDEHDGVGQQASDRPSHRKPRNCLDIFAAFDSYTPTNASAETRVEMPMQLSSRMKLKGGGEVKTVCMWTKRQPAYKYASARCVVRIRFDVPTTAPEPTAIKAFGGNLPSSSCLLEPDRSVSW
jgi:hypothetical protein